MCIVNQTLTKFCIEKGVESSEERIDLTSSILLKKYSEKQILQALGKLIYKHQFFPCAATISKEIESGATQKDMAEVGASKILECAANFSHYDTGGARSFLGPELYGIMERFGGLESLARLTYSELPTTRAQLRNFVSSHVSENSLVQLDIVEGKLEKKSISNSWIDVNSKMLEFGKKLIGMNGGGEK